MTQHTDVRWRIGDVTVDGLLSEQPTWSVGDSETLEFYLGEESVDGRAQPDPSLEGTHGGDLGVTMGGYFPACYGAPAYATPDGGRAREDAYVDPNETPYGQLREFVRYSGSATVELSLDSVPLIREHIPARADIESFVVPIEPVGPDVDWASGAWVLVEGATDNSIVAATDAWLAIELDVTVLAPLEEYPTREALKADMAPDIIPE